eukprot:6443625-Pyramimonas_sp.AAC.1
MFSRPSTSDLAAHVNTALEQSSLTKDPTIYSCECLIVGTAFGACEGCAEIGGTDACGHRHWGL